MMNLSVHSAKLNARTNTFWKVNMMRERLGLHELATNVHIQWGLEEANPILIHLFMNERALTVVILCLC